MPIIFDSATRKSISRRIVKIPLENIAFDRAVSDAGNAATTFQSVDDGNKLFFTQQLNIATFYETERANLDGTQVTTLADWEASMIASVDQTGGNVFFLVTGPTTNLYPTPYIITEINGAPTSISGSYEWNSAGSSGIIDYPPIADAISGKGVLNIETILTAGFNTGASATILDAGYTPGDPTITVNAAAGFATGTYIKLQSGAKSAILLITNIVGVTFTITAIAESSGAIGIGSSVVEAFGGFTQAERQTLVASTAAQQDILDALTTVAPNGLIQRVTAWQSSLNTQRTALNSNEDSRVARQTQKVAELLDIDNSLSIISAWIALPNSGVGAKFDNAPLATITAEITARKAVIPTRSTQITASLGSVIYSGGSGQYTEASADLTAIYYQRYKFLDVRINRGFGSMSKARTVGRGTSILTTQKSNNETLYTNYTSAMRATRLKNDADGTVFIEVEDSTDFSIGMEIYVVDEVNSEIFTNIVSKDGDILRLKVEIPSDYTTANLARILRT